jgi:hypothetical protein
VPRQLQRLVRRQPTKRAATRRKVVEQLSQAAWGRPADEPAQEYQESYRNTEPRDEDEEAGYVLEWLGQA